MAYSTSRYASAVEACTLSMGPLQLQQLLPQKREASGGSKEYILENMIQNNILGLLFEGLVEMD